MSDHERPFIEEGSQFGISREVFAEMSEEDQRELMIQWFHFHFEDPVQETPRIDGEYVYPWGGPFDAREQIWENFEGIASEELIESVSDHFEQEGYEWAPTSRGNFYDHPETDEPAEPAQLELFSDEPNDRYGSTEDYEARAQATAAIEELRSLLETPREIGPGHNKPPDDDAEPDEVGELRPALQELSAELGKTSPTISLVKHWAAPLREALVASAKWGLKKIDQAVDGALKAVGAGAVGWLGIHYSDLLRVAYDAVVHWLSIVTTAPF